MLFWINREKFYIWITSLVRANYSGKGWYLGVQWMIDRRTITYNSISDNWDCIAMFRLRINGKWSDHTILINSDIQIVSLKPHIQKFIEKEIYNEK